MEENKKYYTPEIIEFHVGFEYEERFILLDLNDLQEKSIKEFLDNIENSKTKYRTIDTPKTIEDIASLKEFCEKYLTNPRVKYKVKYLDKEDIESLQYSLDTVSKYGIHYNFIKNNYYIRVLKEDYSTVEICKLTNNPYENNGNNYTLFEGTIKNKSELKKTLQMLNIL